MAKLCAQVLLVVGLLGIKSTRSVEVGEFRAQMQAFVTTKCLGKDAHLGLKETKPYFDCFLSEPDTIKSVDSTGSGDLASLRKAVLAQFEQTCAVWPVQKKCKRNNFKFIKRCLNQEDKFVYDVTVAYFDTICNQGGKIYLEFLQKGGAKCMQQLLPNINEELSKCFYYERRKQTQINKNLSDVGKCIMKRFSSCPSKDAKKLLQQMLLDAFRFYDNNAFEEQIRKINSGLKFNQESRRLRTQSERNPFTQYLQN